MVTARQLLEVGGIYEGAWHTGPPVMVWLYAAFAAVFGNSALMAIRVFTCIYIYLSAIVFNGILAENKSFRRNAGLISILFVILVCTPWYSQELNASLFVLLPVVLTFSQINQLADRHPDNRWRMFVAGIWMLLAIMASYKTVFLLIGVFLAYLILHSFRWKEFMSFGAGMLACFMVIILWLYRGGVLVEWWQQGVLYYLDYLGFAGESFYSYDAWKTLALLGISWGPLMVLALVGFIHFRLNFYQLVRKARSTETMMAIWLVGVLIVLLFKIDRLIMPDFILLIPPLAFYIARTFDFPIITQYRVPVLILLLATPLWQYSGYLGMVLEAQAPWLTPNQEEVLRNGGLALHTSAYSKILQEIEQLPDEAGIWVMGDNPDVYLRSGRVAPVPYTDYRMAFHKLEDLPGYEESNRSRGIPSSELFRRFRQEVPAMVLDAGNNFPPLQHRFPGIFGQFSSQSVASWTIYRSAVD